MVEEQCILVTKDNHLEIMMETRLQSQQDLVESQSSRGELGGSWVQHFTGCPSKGSWADRDDVCEACSPVLPTVKTQQAGVASLPMPSVNPQSWASALFLPSPGHAFS